MLNRKAVFIKTAQTVFCHKYMYTGNHQKCVIHILYYSKEKQNMMQWVVEEIDQYRRVFYFQRGHALSLHF